MRLRSDATVVCFLFAILCHLMVAKEVSAITVVGDDTPRIVGFWQRVGYPGIAEKTSLNLLSMGDNAVKTYLEFHALPIKGSYAERVEKDILLPDKNDRLKAGLQKGIEEYPPVLLYQTDRDTIALISVTLSRIKIPRYEISQQYSNDSIMYLRFTRVCKHYLTSDSSIVRRSVCRDCPLDYQIFDEGYNWLPDADNGMAIPITNLVVRSLYKQGEYVQRHYRTRLLSTPVMNKLISDLQTLNVEIDSALDASLSNYEQLLTKVGTKDPKVEDTYHANGYGIPVKVKLYSENTSSTGNRTAQQFVIPRQQFIPNESPSFVADVIYKKPEINMGTSLDADLTWDDVNTQFVKGPKYNKIQFADELGLGESGPDWPKCCFRLHTPQSKLALLNTKVLAHRIFALNEFSRVIDNSVNLVRQTYKRNTADSLRYLIDVLKKEHGDLADKAKQVHDQLVFINNAFKVESRNKLIQEEVTADKASDVAINTTTTFDLDLDCQPLQSAGARESVASIAWLISKAAGAPTAKVQLGRWSNTSDRIAKTTQFTIDSMYFYHLNKLLIDLEDMISRHDDTSRLILREERNKLNLAIQLHQAQYNQPVATQRFLRLRGNCHDNHALKLFAISASRDPALIEADEDDVVEGYFQMLWMRAPVVV